MKKMNDIRMHHILIILLFLLLSYIYGINQFKNNSLINTFDIDFQLSRVAGLSNVWHSPINFETYGSYGQPINIFYGWLTLYPAYILYYVTNNLVTSYNIYIFLLTFATLSFSYISMFGIYKKKFISIIFSLLYTFSMYRTLSIFYRGALGEVIALAILPLIFSSVYKIIIQNKNDWLQLGISFSLLFYTHVLSAFMAFIFILIIYLSALCSKLDNKKDMTIIFLKSGLNALILSLPFLLSLLQQQSYQKINPPGKSDLANRALTFHEIVIGSLKSDFSTYSIGFLLLILVIISSFFLLWFKPQYKYIYFLGVITLLMTSKLFPWSYFQNTPIQMIQFPWRLMGIATLLLSFTSSYLISSFCTKYTYKITVLYVITLFLISLNIYSVANSPHDKDRIYEQNVTDIIANTTTDDYRPIGYEKFDYLINNNKVSVDGKLIDFNKKITANKFIVSLDTNASGFIRLPVYAYKGLQVEVNGVPIKTEKSLVVSAKVPKSTKVICISYKYTLLSKLAFFTALTWLILLFYINIKNLNIKNFLHSIFKNK